MEEENNSSSSMKSLRLSSLCLSHIDHSTSKALDVLQTCKYGTPTQDGSNFSNEEENISSMRKERLSMFQVQLMLKTETSLCIINTME